MERLLRPIRTTGQLAWQVLNEFLADRCPQMAAAISFYALFSLPPLLVLVIMLTEPVLEPDTVAALIERELAQLIGPQGMEQVRTLLENASRPGQGGIVPAILGIGAFLFGATAAFTQLQGALNAAWRVGPDPRRGDILNFLLKRAFSFLMILAIGALLLASLVVSAVLGAFGEALEAIDPRFPSAVVLRLVDGSVTFSIVTVVFASMYRYLPDAEVRWRHTLLGGVITAILFTLGKLGIGYYLGRSDPGSAFGAAGSLALLLIWIYYSSMILLFGAEATQVWMRRRGYPIRPSPGAVRVVMKSERYDPDAPEEQKGREEPVPRDGPVPRNGPVPREEPEAARRRSRSGTAGGSEPLGDREGTGRTPPDG